MNFCVPKEFSVKINSHNELLQQQFAVRINCDICGVSTDDVIGEFHSYQEDKYNTLQFKESCWTMCDNCYNESYSDIIEKHNKMGDILMQLPLPFLTKKMILDILIDGDC